MIRKFSVLAGVALAATVGAGVTTHAQNVDVIKQRKEILKSFGAAAKDPGAMLKGEAAYDGGKVAAALKTFQDGAAKLPKLFPDDSKIGGETEALPVIWDAGKNKDFLERFSKLATESKAAEGAIKDEASFKTEWPKLLGANCKGCHDTYRKPK